MKTLLRIITIIMLIGAMAPIVLSIDAAAGPVKGGLEVFDLADVHVEVTAGGVPVAGATVALDLDDDGVWDQDDEPQGVTNDDGLIVFANILSILDPHHRDDATAIDWSPARIMTGNLRGTIGAATVQFDFVVPADAGVASLSLFDVRGRRVAGARGDGDLSLAMPPALPAGVYFMQLSAGSSAPVTHRFTSVGVRARSVTAHRLTPSEAVVAGWLDAPISGPAAKDGEDAHRINLLVDHPDHDPVVQPEVLVAGLNQYTVDLLGGESDAAVVVLDIADLTAREIAAFSMLASSGRRPTYVAADAVQGDELAALGLVAATEEGALAAPMIDQLIAAGCRVLLYYNAGAAVGGEWSSAISLAYYDLIAESDTIFLDGYCSNLAARVQAAGDAYRITGSYPAGWTTVATNSVNTSNKTVLYREHASGGKGLIYTYQPGEFSEVGKNMADLVYRWLEGTPAHAGVTVPAGHVAFVITGYQDGGTPDLTEEETAHYNQLLTWGHDVTFLRYSRLADSDLGGATMITGVHYPSVDRYTVSEQLAAGVDVMLVHNAAAALGGEWSSMNSLAYRDLHVESDADYLAGYPVGEVITVQATGAAYRTTSSYPAGWIVLGRNVASVSSKTAFANTAGVGRGAIYTYNPTSLTAQGETLYQGILDWLAVD
jgi:hypothetical protein